MKIPEKIRILPILFVVSMISTSCGGSAGDSATQARLRSSTTTTVGVEESTPQTTAATDVPDCETTTIIDEYGFAVEITTCDGEVVASVDGAVLEESIDTLDQFGGSGAGTVLSTGIRDRLILQTGCVAEPPDVASLADSRDVGTAIRLIPDDAVQKEVVDAFARISEGDTACLAQDPAAWATATRGALHHLQAFGSALGATALPRDVGVPLDGEADDLTLVTADAMNTYDRLYPVLTGKRPLEGSDFWFSANHFGHIDGFQHYLQQSSPPTMVLIGSSLIARGLDPMLLNENLDSGLVSFAMDSAIAPVNVVLAQQAMEISPSIDTIIWGQSSHPFFRPCLTDLGFRIQDPLRLQRAAFGGWPQLLQMPARERLLGNISSPTRYESSPIAEVAELFHGNWNAGATIPFEGQDADAKADQLQTYREVYTDVMLCESLFNLFEDTLTDWRQAGLTTILFIPPLSDEMTALHPLGRAGHDMVVERLRAIAERSGARFADYSNSVGDESFYDLNHLNIEGRRELSLQLAEFIAAG